MPPRGEGGGGVDHIPSCTFFSCSHNVCVEFKLKFKVCGSLEQYTLWHALFLCSGNTRPNFIFANRFFLPTVGRDAFITDGGDDPKPHPTTLVFSMVVFIN